MDRTLTCEYTDELILQNLRYSLGWRNFFMLVLVYMLFAGCAVAISFAGGASPGRVAVIVVAVVALLGGAWYWYMYLHMRKSTLAALAKLPHRQQKFTFSDDFVLVEGPTGESRLNWGMLQKVECFEQLWRLQFLNAQYLLPAALIDPELAAFIEGKARQQEAEMFRNGFKVKGTEAK